jgi:2-polyprenyl-3-methyl-5-hydroxy-6-metoxy-1,4-benzoquinol methylase
MNPFDPARAEAFGGRMLAALNETAMIVMTAIGHRTGLFDLMAELPPSTSAALAERADLNERYVREWLNALTVARVVDYDAGSRTYALPAEHAACLTRAAAPNNLAVFAQYVRLFGLVENDVIECFREGGGVPYERFEGFHEIMAEDSAQSVLSALHDHILPLVPALHERLERGIDVLDVGCGQGRALLSLARSYPRSRLVGYDLSPEAIEHARASAAREGLGNVTFTVRDTSSFDQDAEQDAYDLITTFDAIHDQARPLAVLKGIRRALRPDGVYLMQDIRATSHVEQDVDLPLAPLLYAVSCMHCMTVSLAQGGDGLGTMWGRELAGRMLREAGFDQVEIHELSHDVQNDYYVCSTSSRTR